MRASRVVLVLGCGVDAEVTVDRGQDVLRVFGVVFDDGGVGVGGADGSAALDSPTGEGGAEGAHPVVAAGGGVHARGAAVFPPGDDERRLQQPPLVEVFDEGRVGLVEGGEEAGLQGPEVVVVRVPPPQVDGDQSHARFDHPPRQQQPLVPAGVVATRPHAGGVLRRIAVAVADGLRLGIEVERLANAGAGEDFPRLPLIAVDGIHHAEPVDIAAQQVEAAQESLTVLDLLGGDALGNGQIRDDELRPFRGGVGQRFKRRALRPEIGGAGAGDHPRNHHIGEHRRIEMLQLASDDRTHAGMQILVLVHSGGVPGEDDLVAARVADVAVLGGMLQTADDGPFVHDAGGLRQEFAELDAGDRGGDRLELAPDIDRGVGLHVPGFELTGAAAHVEHDGGGGPLLRGARGRLGFRSQHVGQHQAPRAEQAAADGRAAIDFGRTQQAGEVEVGGQAVGHAINPCETRRGWGASWCARSVPEGKGSRIKYALSEDMGEEGGGAFAVWVCEQRIVVSS